MVRALAALAAAFLPAFAAAAGLADLSDREAINGLKDAIVKSSRAAVAQLGVKDGFFGNDRVKIPLPPSLRSVEAVMRSIGMSPQADELVLRMNRAAEAAVPRAKKLLVEAVRKMTVKDAKGILAGGDDAATQYFRRATSDALAERFRPIVRRAMAKVRLAEKYDEIAAGGAKLGLVKEEDAKLEDYVTRKALEGLFATIAQEEKKIRENPAKAASGVIRRVFGAIGK